MEHNLDASLFLNLPTFYHTKFTCDIALTSMDFSLSPLQPLIV